MGDAKFGRVGRVQGPGVTWLGSATHTLWTLGNPSFSLGLSVLPWTGTWCLSDVSAILRGEGTWVCRRNNGELTRFWPLLLYFKIPSALGSMLWCIGTCFDINIMGFFPSQSLESNFSFRKMCYNLSCGFALRGTRTPVEPA